MDATAELRKLVGDLSKGLEAEKKRAETYREQLLDTRHELVQKDIAVENQKKALENVRMTLERMTKENQALRQLVNLWI